ncbi:hypothetical protein [Amycolatopsis sp.]|uniref:hypothetical protein n=1 Tax=Amycolatopsis sp. TaxID=37632 RepID=UPI002C168C82|nr:hypothetical protein [Amycolatopsis sp.]HVV12119.1 hypothetical protein [Amycolatopsis sp.]
MQDQVSGKVTLGVLAPISDGEGKTPRASLTEMDAVTGSQLVGVDCGTVAPGQRDTVRIVRAVAVAIVGIGQRFKVDVCHNTRRGLEAVRRFGQLLSARATPARRGIVGLEFEPYGVRGIATRKG